MKKLVEPPLGQLGIIADSIHYSGYLNDDNDVLSDVSFYDYEDDGTEDELYVCHSMKKSVDRFTSKVGKNSKLARKGANRVRDREEQDLKKIQKGRKPRFETSDEQSTSGTDAELDQDICEKPQIVLSSQKKLKDDASSFDDSEGDVTVQRSKKFLETTPKRRGIGQLHSGFRGEKVSGSKIKEEYPWDSVDVRERDGVFGGTAVQASQRKKKLCKAVDLNSTHGRVPKGKNKSHLVEIKLKTGKKINLKAKNSSAMEHIHTNKLEDFSSDLEASPKTSSRKSSKQGFVEEQTLIKDVRLVRAGRLGESRSSAVARMSPSSTGHAVKHREIKREHVIGSLLTCKREVSNQQLVERSTKEASKELHVSQETFHSMVDHHRHAIEKVCDNGLAGEEVSSGVTEGAEGNKDFLLDENGKGNANVGITKVGWVMCDSCKKWRCIPASLIDMIESTDCGWFCKDNPDKRFADCSKPQEKTNKEINRELNLSEVSFCEEGDEKHPEIDSKLLNGLEHQSQPSTWTLIKHNIFLHRCRKTETLDEQMVCTCKPPEDGSLGCRDDCHNRMLNIECVSQTCPCGDACFNQKFQRRLYKKVNWFRCGKKGFGLQVMEDVSKGAFIIEYVGEVLNVAAYEARQKQYALEGQKHFYFMTLSGSEIIDACYKGNLGRFINHSCEPNCTTEKWMVNGEVCIGLFAIRDLKKGEEITFDYNFVRLCGAAAKKCLCGSRDCRGFIGGDPATPQSVVQSDSDEDDPEPIMIKESSEDESRIEDSKIGYRKMGEKVEGNSSLELQAKARNWMRNEVSERQDASSKQVKTKASIKASASANVKKLTIEINGGHFEGVEEELNKLVDENGGLWKSQPAVATEYLKLLVRTAFSSSDTSNGEGSRSTRDLSLVLDALLKTQSRAILLEVLTKNGSQIMHKIVKQSRMDYKRTPIIRKILKVLEFLAVRRILSLEQINAEPSRSGAESIKDAIFQLCRHPDTEVQNMARHFEEKYVKSNLQKPLRKGQRPSSDLSKWRLFPKQTQQANSVAVAASEDEATRKRKRPNRWDQPSQEVLDTTLAGGLPQSFWPFNANNLLGGSHQSNASNQCIRQTESAAADELGAMHPGPPSFPMLDNNTEAAHIATGVVSGIPVEQFTTGSTMGYISQQGICIGIPVSQFQGGGISGLDLPYMPTYTHKASHALGGQTSPFSSNMEAQESQPHDLEIEFKGKVGEGEESKVTFGISHSQFFQQMHVIFGSAFHPWQLQMLMAPHARGPFLSGDARIRDLGFLNDTSRQPNEYCASEGTSSILVEPIAAIGYRQEAEPAAPGLSPPLHPPPPPPPPPRPCAYPSPPVQVAKRMNTRPYMGNDDLERNNMPYQQLKSSCWKPQNWNSPRGPKFLGNNKYRNPAFRRDFSHSQRFNRHNFGRQGPSRSHTSWEGNFSRRQSDRSWGSFDARGMTHEESMEVEGVGGYNGPHGPLFQNSENPSGSLPLERPWGYKQEHQNEDCSNYSGEFPQQRVDDTLNSWGVHN